MKPFNSGIHPIVIHAFSLFLISRGKLPKVARIGCAVRPLNLPSNALEKY